MRCPIHIAAAAAGLTLLLATTAPAAIIQVGNVVYNQSTFETDGAADIQAVIDSDGDFDSVFFSPLTRPVSDIIEPNAIFFPFMIQRETGETDMLAIVNLIFELGSDDSLDKFDDMGDWSGTDYDSLLRGFIDGPDGIRFSADDVELSDGTADFDYVVTIGEGRGFASSDEAYFLSETPFDVRGAYSLLNGFLIQGGGSNTTSIVVPEPGSLALVSAGAGLLLLRRRK